MVTRQSYRDAMARFGAAVNVVTTDGPAGRRGFTASAVCSVTDDPPTLLVCVNRRNESHPALIGNGVLCVNTLAAGQEELSFLFSSEPDHEVRFAAGDWYRAGDRRAGAARGGGVVRLPHRAGDRGRHAQRDLRPCAGDPARLGA